MKKICKNFLIIVIVIAGLLLFILSNQIGGWRAFIVSSPSMEPTIPTGSLLLTRFVYPQTLKKNDIITFIPPTGTNEFVTHRITQTNHKQDVSTFKTKGDKNTNEDTWILAGGGIVGKVMYNIPYLGYLLSFTQTKLGILFFILLPATSIIIDEIIIVKNIIKHHKKKDPSSS